MHFKSPKDIRTMADLRTQIDALDRDLIRQLALRQAHIDRAAEIKPGEGLPARIDTRVEEVLKNVSSVAIEEGFDANLARSMWAQMIEAMIAREEKTLGPSTPQQETSQ